MVKDKTIIIRVDDETKRRVEAAAIRKGKSMTTFIMKAAERAAAQVEKEPEAKRSRGGVPTFFRGCCLEASRGGTSGYSRPGYHLAIAVDRLIPWGVDDDEWAEELNALFDLLSPLDPTTKGQKYERFDLELRDDDKVFAWFEEHYPKCMALIPSRRRAQFVEGVYRAFDDEKIDFPPD